MTAKTDLKFISALILQYEYRQCLAKIEEYTTRIQSAKENKDRKEAKRLQGGLTLFETHKSNLESEYKRRNIPESDWLHITE